MKFKHLKTLFVSFAQTLLAYLVFDRCLNIHILLLNLESLSIILSAALPCNCEDSQFIKSVIIRYTFVSYILALRKISLKVNRKFPTHHSLVEAGLLSENEMKTLKLLRKTIGWNRSRVLLTCAMNIMSMVWENSFIDADLPTRILLVELTQHHRKLQKLHFDNTVSISFIYTLITKLFIFSSIILIVIIYKLYFIINDWISFIHSNWACLFSIVFMCWVILAESFIALFKQTSKDLELNELINHYVNTMTINVNGKPIPVKSFKNINKHNQFLSTLFFYIIENQDITVRFPSGLLHSKNEIAEKFNQLREIGVNDEVHNCTVHSFLLQHHLLQSGTNLQHHVEKDCDAGYITSNGIKLQNDHSFNNHDFHEIGKIRSCDGKKEIDKPLTHQLGESTTIDTTTFSDCQASINVNENTSTECQETNAIVETATPLHGKGSSTVNVKTTPKPSTMLERQETDCLDATTLVENNLTLQDQTINSNIATTSLTTTTLLDRQSVTESLATTIHLQGHTEATVILDAQEINTTDASTITGTTPIEDQARNTPDVITPQKLTTFLNGQEGNINDAPTTLENTPFDGQSKKTLDTSKHLETTIIINGHMNNILNSFTPIEPVILNGHSCNTIDTPTIIETIAPLEDQARNTPDAITHLKLTTSLDGQEGNINDASTTLETTPFDDESKDTLDKTKHLETTIIINGHMNNTFNSFTPIGPVILDGHSSNTINNMTDTQPNLVTMLFWKPDLKIDQIKSINTLEGISKAITKQSVSSQSTWGITYKILPKHNVKNPTESNAASAGQVDSSSYDAVTSDSFGSSIITPDNISLSTQHIHYFNEATPPIRSDCDDDYSGLPFTASPPPRPPKEPFTFIRRGAMKKRYSSYSKRREIYNNLNVVPFTQPPLPRPPKRTTTDVETDISCDEIPPTNSLYGYRSYHDNMRHINEWVKTTQLATHVDPGEHIYEEVKPSKIQRRSKNMVGETQENDPSCNVLFKGSKYKKQIELYF